MKYSSLIKGTFIFGFVVSTLMVSVMYGAGFFEEVAIGMDSQLLAALEFWVGIGIAVALATNLWFIPVHIKKLLSLTKNKINKTYVESDTYIYTRDLPNYNAAVAGALYDFKSTFEEDYVAGVLDLIAKGYILERDNHLVVDTKKTRDGLLKNEIYILGSCEKAHQNLKSLINFEFYRALKEDMYSLGFYKKQIWIDKIREKFQYWWAKDRDRTVKITYFSCIFCFFAFVWGLSSNVTLTLLALLLLYIVGIVFLRKNKLTKLGEDEKESMTKLKHFLERETDFKDKELAEKKLWDRYPAFAVALGVNKEMSERIVMKLKRKN